MSRPPSGTLLRKGRHTLSGVLLTLLFPPLLHASEVTQHAAALALDLIQVTASRGEGSAALEPQAVSIVDAGMIARETRQTWTDLLRGEPGAFLQSSGPGQSIVIVRGLKGSEVLHLVDGMRLNNSFFRNSPSQYIALVDPWNIARVELLRGPGATLYGSDAMGGVVQILSPEYRFDESAWQTVGKLRLQYTSADLARIARAEGAIGNRELSLSGGYTVMNYGERDLGGSGREPLTDYLARGYDGKLLWSPGGTHEIMLSGAFFEYPKLARYFDVAGGPGGEGEDIQSFFMPNDRQFLHARYRYLAPLGFMHGVELHLGQQIVNDERLRQPNESRIDTEQNRSTLNGLTAQAWTPIGDRLHLQYGLDLYRDTVDSARQRTPLDTGVTAPTTSTFPDGARQDQLGAYLYGQWTPSPLWRVDSGLRYSRVDTELPATPVSAATRFSLDDVTWQLGALRRLSEALSVTATAARGFRAPNIFDLGTLGPRPSSGAEQVNVPNPDLEAETVTTVDLGLRWTTSNIIASLTGFYSDYDNRIEAREPTGNTVPEGEYGCSDPAGCVEVQSRNIAKARFWGLEGGLRARLNTAELYATLNWTYGQELRDDAPTTPANRIPPLNGQIGALLQLRNAIGIEPYVLFSARQDRLDDDDRNDTRIDPDGTAGWASVNLRGSWQARDWLRLQAEASNLLDKDYREHGSGVDAAGAGISVGVTAMF